MSRWRDGVKEHPVGQAYDRRAEGYDNYHVDTKSLAENRYVSQRLSAILNPETRVFDIGCGTGLLLDLIKIHPDQYIGLDISEGMLNHARKKYPNHKFYQGNAEDLGDRFGPQDLVISLFGSPSYCDAHKLSESIRNLTKGTGKYFLMYCSPRYVERRTYINKSLDLLKSYSSKELKKIYQPSSVWGMSWLVDKAPPWLSSSAMLRLLKFDVFTAGQIDADRCFFMVIEG